MTSSSHHRDETFSQYRRHANNEDLLFGGYHFLERDKGDQQAIQHLERIDSSPGGLRGLLYGLDVEGLPRDPSSGPSYEDVLAYVETFQKYIKHARLIIYTASYWWGAQYRDGSLHHGVMGNPPAPKGTELWAAVYLSGNPIGTIKQLGSLIAPPMSAHDPWIEKEHISTWQYPAILQFGSRGEEQQINGKPDVNSTLRYVDLNASFFSLRSLQRLAGIAS